MKECIFCGRLPINKNKEHILPEWLIQMTGNQKRPFNIGFDFYKQENRLWSPDNFVFPACTACNEKYGSNLERQTKEVVKKLLNYEKIDSLEIDILMDWLDKVRVGLWLGFYSLDKNIFSIKPHYFIDNRVGTCDRAAFIYTCNENHKGLNLPILSPIFYHHPVCFFIRINHLVIFNISTSYLLSKKIGFPFPSNVSYQKKDDDFSEKCTMSDPLEIVNYPFITKDILPFSVAFYQPIIHPSAKGYIKTTKYISDHILNKGLKGDIYFDDNKKHGWLAGSNIKLEKKESHDLKELLNKICLQTYDYQQYFYEKHICLKNLSKNDRASVKNQKKKNIVLHKDFVKSAMSMFNRMNFH